jgi:hypothetical protein
MWWIILLIIVGLFLLFRLIIFLTGNWRATLNRVITQYVAWKQMEPKYTEKENFMAVLDGRYQKPNKDVGGLLVRMYERKNQIKLEIESEIESKMNVLDKYSLPVLIYTCLLIEENNYLSQRKSVEELLEPITQEVKRQGFSKYC